MALSESEINQIAEKTAVEIKREINGQWMLLHSISEIGGSPGKVVDSGEAAMTSCNCFTYNGEDYCYSPGIIGMLEQEQEKDYCPVKTYTVDEDIKKRFKDFREAVGEAKKKIEGVPEGESLQPWLEAMSEELKERGIKI